MHEFGIVEQLIDALQHRLGHQGVTSVQAIRLRKSSAFAEGPVHQAFEMLTPGTMLEGTKLVIEEVPFDSVCAACGHSAVVTTDDLIGHLFICPECGAGQEIDEARGLVILGVTINDEEIPVEVQADHDHDHHDHHH